MAEADPNLDLDSEIKNDDVVQETADVEESVAEERIPSKKSSQVSRQSLRRPSADRPSGTTTPKQPSRESQRQMQTQDLKEGPSQDQKQSPAQGGNEEKDEEFRFYLQFVKSLVFYIRDINDRGAVSSWILKLQQANSQAALRVEYVKLLLFCLQRRHLPFMFAEKPDPNSELTPFPDGLQLYDMMRRIIVEDNAKEDGGGDEGYVFETSSDLKEYVAVQKIPSYGVHCYMAVSDEPMTKWNKVRSKGSKIPGTSKLKCKDKNDQKPTMSSQPPPQKQSIEWKVANPSRKSGNPSELEKPMRENTRLAAGGGSGIPKQVCVGGANFTFPETEVEMEDDFLVVDEDDIRPSAAPTISRFRNKLRPSRPHCPGPESFASQRVVREEDMVDSRGHIMRGMVVGQGVSGSYRDPRDGVTIRMRKTMAARDFDAPSAGRKCQSPVRSLRHTREMFEPQEQVCPGRQARTWSPQSRYPQQYHREEVPCYPCDDDFNNDYDDYDDDDERVVCTNRRWEA